MVPLQVASLRRARLRRAANDAIDAAALGRHDADPAHIHTVMHCNSANCRWCGVRADEARRELEEDE